MFRCIDKIFEPVLKAKMAKDNDELFKKILEIDFLPDLVFVSNFNHVELSEEEKVILNILKGKYHGGCPSELYDKTSKHLQREYDFFHKVISELLY